jgi:hypothetical protein
MLFIFTTMILLMTAIDECESFIVSKYFILFLIISYLLFCISIYYLSTGPIWQENREDPSSLTHCIHAKTTTTKLSLKRKLKETSLSITKSVMSLVHAPNGKQLVENYNCNKVYKQIIK